MRVWLVALTLLASGGPLAAQPPTGNGFAELAAAPAMPALAAPVSLTMTKQPVRVVLAEIARQARLSWVADESLPGLDQPITLIVSRVAARVALGDALAGTPLRAVVHRSGQVVILRKVEPAPPPAPPAPPPMERLRLAGYVRSASSNEVIRTARVIVDGLAPAKQTNEEGFYAMQVTPGRHLLQVRALGFAPLDTSVTLTRSMTLDLVLPAPSVRLSSVTVQAAANADRPDLDPTVPDMSVVRLDLKTTRLIPPLLGEVDPIRALTLLPGVTTNSDASTAFSVRGGGADQNLMQLDEATVFNASHVLGFLSTFNADAIDDMTLYKGAIPARFGGRLSSVVDVRQREGNAKEFTGRAAIGLLASRLLVEGPLGRTGRGSWMVAARRSYADLFTGFARDTNIRNSRAYFYDLNAKGNLRLGATGSLMLSGYAGRDRFAQSFGGFGAGWGNVTGTVRWNQAFANRLFSKVSLATSRYDYLLDFNFAALDEARFDARIASTTLRIDESLQLSNRHRLEFGVEGIDHDFRPGTFGPRGSDTTRVRRRRSEARLGRSAAAYVGHEAEFGERVAMRYGVRWAGFERIGPGSRFRYANDAPVRYDSELQRYEPGRLIDSVRVGRGTPLVRYGGFEPRASMRLSLTRQHSLKASYARTQQFIQLVSNSNAPTPVDLWEPVGPDLAPQRADQYALGYSGQWSGLELTVEGYYRDARNVSDFLDGSDIILANRIETQVVQGFGRAYGLELYARRSVGRTRGWVSYTLGRSEQRFPVPRNAGATRGGGVNDGRWYPSPFDKTHTLVVTGARDLTTRWTLGTAFQLASGLPITLPRSRYVVDGFVVAEYGPRNSDRLPLYHRLDLTLSRTLRRGEFQFGVLNAYNRFNAQALRARQVINDGFRTEAVQTSIFGIVPTINYAFTF